ncbi:MAG: hypothetical protein R3A80_09845 [Bdellovibrionota bacterium]
MNKGNLFKLGVFFLGIQFNSLAQSQHQNGSPSVPTPQDGSNSGVNQGDVEENDYNEKVSKKKEELKKIFEEKFSEWGSRQEDPRYKKFFEDIGPEVAKYVDSMDMSYQKASALKGVSAYKHLETDEIFEHWTNKEANEFMHAKIMDFRENTPPQKIDTAAIDQVGKSAIGELTPEQAKEAVIQGVNSATVGNRALGFDERSDALNAQSNEATKNGAYMNAGQMAANYGMSTNGIDREHVDGERYQNVYNQSYKNRPLAERTQFDWNFGVLTPQLKDGQWTLYDVTGNELGLPVGLPDGRGGAYTGIMMSKDNYGLEKGWIVDSFGKVYDNAGKLAGVVARGQVFLAPREGGTKTLF